MVRGLLCRDEVKTIGVGTAQESRRYQSRSVVANPVPLRRPSGAPVARPAKTGAGHGPVPANSLQGYSGRRRRDASVLDADTLQDPIVAAGRTWKLIPLTANLARRGGDGPVWSRDWRKAPPPGRRRSCLPARANPARRPRNASTSRAPSRRLCPADARFRALKYPRKNSNERSRAHGASQLFPPASSLPLIDQGGNLNRPAEALVAIPDPGRHYSVPVGGIISLWWAASFPYGGLPHLLFLCCSRPRTHLSSHPS